MEPSVPAPRHPSWAATGIRGQLLLFGAGVLAVLAVLTTIAAVHSSPRRSEQVITDPAAPGAGTVDAAGCPVTLTCTSTATAPAPILASLARYFPHSSVTFAVSTVGPHGSRTYRTSLGADLSSGVSLQFRSQCVPAAAGFSEVDNFSSTQHNDLSGNSIVSANSMQLTIPGTAGCSVDVQVRAVGPADQLEGGALGDTILQFAHSPASQLHL